MNSICFQYRHQVLYYYSQVISIIVIGCVHNCFYFEVFSINFDCDRFFCFRKNVEYVFVRHHDGPLLRAEFAIWVGTIQCSNFEKKRKFFEREILRGCYVHCRLEKMISFVKNSQIIVIVLLFVFYHVFCLPTPITIFSHNISSHLITYQEHNNFDLLEKKLNLLLLIIYSYIRN